LADELLKIIKNKIQKLSASMDESADEIPDGPSPVLNKIMQVIYETAEAQILYGSHYTVMDKLFDSIEDTIIEKIHEAKWDFIDNSGEDMSESQALESVTEGIKEELQGLFEHWNKEFFRRTLARFEITSTN
jgi:hypothetical protein